MVQAPSESSSLPAAKRLVSLDAYRGFIMLILVAEGFGIEEFSRQFEGQPLWDFINYQFSHCQWIGCAFWDLIQPSFTFMVGVAMPYSYAKRRARGDSPLSTTLHVLKRALILILLGIFLRSNHRSQTYFTFEDVLTQIGLGYAFVYLVLGRGFRFQATVALLLLGGYWLAFLLYPTPGPDFDYSSVGVGEDWSHLTGLWAHWDKNTNLAHAFDVWFLNLFPRESPFQFNGGGYHTLSFIPSMGTMILGIMAGEWLRTERAPIEKFNGLAIAGGVCLALGLLWGWTLCPIVKRIWTPSWTLFSAGWTLWMLAAFFAVIDLWGYRRWCFPLLVVGMNSIFFYCSGLSSHWIVETLKTHFGQDLFSGAYGPILQNTSVAVVVWMVGWWMYRNKIFLRI